MSIMYAELPFCEDKVDREGKIPPSTSPLMGRLPPLRPLALPASSLLTTIALVTALLLPCLALTLAASLAIEASDATLLVAPCDPEAEIAVHRRGVVIAVLSERVRSVRVSPGNYVIRRVERGDLAPPTGSTTRQVTVKPGQRRWLSEY